MFKKELVCFPNLDSGELFWLRVVVICYGS